MRRVYTSDIRPGSFEVVLRIHLERDQRLGSFDSLHLGHPAGDDLGQVLVVRHANDRHQVPLAGDGVDLGDALDVGDGLGGLGDFVDLALDQHHRVDHSKASCQERSRATAMPIPPLMHRVARPSE